MLEKGDEVLIPAPYWVTYPDIVLFTGATPVPIMTDASDGFRLRAEDVARAITPRTKILIVNSPSNPSGAVVPNDEFEKIYEVCRAKNVWVMTDECYSHFVYGNQKPYSLASVSGSKPNIMVMGSLSKTFAMTGWRVGYTLAPAELISAMIKLQSQSTSNTTSIAQYAALEALTGPMDTVTAMLAEYSKRRDRIVSGLRAIPGVTCVEPGGAFYAYPSIAAHLGNGIRGLDRAGESAARKAAPRVRSGRCFRHARLHPAFVRHLHRSHRGRACAAWKNSLPWRKRPGELGSKTVGAGACRGSPRFLCLASGARATSLRCFPNIFKEANPLAKCG